LLQVMHNFLLALWRGELNSVFEMLDAVAILLQTITWHEASANQVDWVDLEHGHSDYYQTTWHLKSLLSLSRFPKMGYPQIIPFHRIFHYKPSSYWGTLHFRNPSSDLTRHRHTSQTLRAAPHGMAEPETDKTHEFPPHHLIGGCEMWISSVKMSHHDHHFHKNVIVGWTFMNILDFFRLP
jgi:hypothetical protein